ncbi:MAG: ABC transporter substrate-binding protein [Bacteroidota bacterium]
MKNLRYLFLIILAVAFTSCGSNSKKNSMPVIGYVDAFQDPTLAKARTGFTDALKKAGYEEGKTVKIEYRNAQGDIPTLTQIVNYYISEKVDAMATCATLSSITAAQKTKTIPIFMTVSPTLKLMKMEGADGKGQLNLFGAVEDLAYIDTSFSIIPKVLKPKNGKLVVGMIFNQSEPQSVDAKKRIEADADKAGVTLVALPLNSSADAQLVTKSLLGKHIDAFFANPDNSVFASFATILKNCNEANVPIFTSEAGLVERGAVAAFGADIYQWGFQAGEQAAQFLKTGKTDGLQPEMVKVRLRVYNATAAQKFKITMPSTFQAVK